MNVKGTATMAAAARVVEPGVPLRLAKAVGVFAIMASAVSQEFGSGINFVLVNSLGSYPAVAWAVPLAMLVAGLLLIPKVALFVRFSQVAPRAGSSYVWLTRTATFPAGFVVAFLWFIGVIAAMGFLAFSFSTFVAGVLKAAGLASGWAVTSGGHMILGTALIVVIFLLHYSGVRNYGTFAGVIFVLVLAATVLTVGYGFATSQSTFLAEVTRATGKPPAGNPGASPAPGAFISVVTLFMFAYGGLTAASSLGGEARDAQRSMPRGIALGWLVALVLFTVISFALFHAVPWWSVHSLTQGGHQALLTTPGLIGLVAPAAVGLFLNLLVAIIVGKTVAPEMLDCSRYLFAWAQDGLLPRAFLHTSRTRAPDLALAVCAGLGVLFLAEATFVGWSIGVVLRSASLVLVFGVLGLGTLHVWFNRRYRGVAWADQLRAHVDVPVFGVLAAVIAVVLLSGVIVVPKLAWYFQPSFQGLVAIAVGLVLYLASRRGPGATHLPLDMPVE
jgi:APA family basic amino acid/polyamine antiporter